MLHLVNMFCLYPKKAQNTKLSQSCHLQFFPCVFRLIPSPLLFYPFLELCSTRGPALPTPSRLGPSTLTRHNSNLHATYGFNSVFIPPLYFLLFLRSFPSGFPVSHFYDPDPFLTTSPSSPYIPSVFPFAPLYKATFLLTSFLSLNISYYRSSYLVPSGSILYLFSYTLVSVHLRPFPASSEIRSKYTSDLVQGVVNNFAKDQ